MTERRVARAPAPGDSHGAALVAARGAVVLDRALVAARHQLATAGPVRLLDPPVATNL
jgi:hypothetical protein